MLQQPTLSGFQWFLLNVAHFNANVRCTIRPGTNRRSSSSVMAPTMRYCARKIVSVTTTPTAATPTPLAHIANARRLSA